MVHSEKETKNIVFLIKPLMYIKTKERDLTKGLGFPNCRLDIVSLEKVISRQISDTVIHPINLTQLTGMNRTAFIRLPYGLRLVS